MLLLKNLEVQVGQLAQQLSEHGSESFSANTQVNPKEQSKVITTRRRTIFGLKDDGECSDKKKNEGVEDDEMEGVEKEKGEK